jgi:hypothetical protein
MIPVTNFSQRDPKWANKRLGFSTLTIGNYGCTLTALSSLVSYVYQETYTPDRVNDMLKKAGGFVGALVLWSRVPLAFGKLKWMKRVYGYKNWEVASYVYLKKTPVLVEVNGAKIGAPRHWVLFLGNQKAMDPWTGNVISTSHYPPTGYSLIQKA